MIRNHKYLPKQGLCVLQVSHHLNMTIPWDRLQCLLHECTVAHHNIVKTSKMGSNWTHSSTINKWNHLSSCKIQLQLHIKNSQSHSLVSSPGKQTYWCLGFWPFTIAQFNTTLWSSVTASNRVGWDRVGAQQSASHSHTNKQITLSSVKLCLHILWHKTVLQSCNMFYASKMCLSFMKNNFNAFDAFWGAFIVLWMIIHNFLEPNRHLTMEVDSEFPDHFIDHNQSWILTLCCTWLSSTNKPLYFRPPKLVTATPKTL
jgi:hypothetical protein